MTHIAVYTVSMTRKRMLYRHFLRFESGAIIELNVSREETFGGIQSVQDIDFKFDFENVK